MTAGTEVFSLCQTATADGSLSASERNALRVWLERNESAEMPAARYVRALISDIVTSGRVSASDLQALWRALEPALPDELRRRRPAALRLVARGRESYEDEPTADRVRNDLLASACFTVAGCASSRVETIERRARTGDPVLLVRAKRRGRSPNAIQVCASNGKPLGLVPEHHASELAPLLDRGARYRAHLRAVLNGGIAPVLIVQSFLYAPSASLGLGTAAQRRIARRKTSPAIWMIIRTVVALLIALAVATVLRR
ncbi:MAG: hypothetical protein JOZ58_16295 [Acetobacteraceae bacterium]|nr:hypothetical protein [Acetobacteraceae bacterium]